MEFSSSYEFIQPMQLYRVAQNYEHKHWGFVINVYYNQFLYKNQGFQSAYSVKNKECLNPLLVGLLVDVCYGQLSVRAVSTDGGIEHPPWCV